LNRLILHYRRFRKDYAGWGLHVWGQTLEKVTWEAPLQPAGEDDYGIYWCVRVPDSAQVLNYVLHRGNEKDSVSDQTLDISNHGNEVWLIEGRGDPTPSQFADPKEAIKALLSKGAGDIKEKAQAYWLTKEIIAWHIGFVPRAIYKLHYSPFGLLKIGVDGIEGGKEIALIFTDDHLNPELTAKYPHLRTAAMLKVLPQHQAKIPEILKGQHVVSVISTMENFLAVAALQIPGVLDDFYAYDGPLGVTFEQGIPTLRVWAPTAKSVTLRLYPDASPNTLDKPIPMTWDIATGVWSVTGDPGWKGMYYLYEVEVFVRQECKLVRNFVTDPYSFSLARNSSRSQIIDLNDPQLMPEGWQEFEAQIAKQNLYPRYPTDRVLYELHVRDFSANDHTVPEEHRCTYLAFTHFDSFGMKHLKRIADAGITHIHLLPVADNATINENRAEWLKPDFNLLANLPPDSKQQQAILAAFRGKDGYNWGYDPYHYTVPEGGYACNPDGGFRIREFRQMVMALGQIGLGVVMDVVFNHTFAAGQDEKSVLDRIVPGYYYRLDHDGKVCTSTCCPNTASEHAMVEKLMVDSLTTWAVQYKIDGFRFDLMGHHMKANMEKVRAALDLLTPEKDGIDGEGIYIYGEGWDFGEVANNARGVNATQWNLRGTGIGTFNDRIRSAMRGGSPFGNKSEQGFVNGLYTDPNEHEQSPVGVQREKLLSLTDQVRIGLVGNLADYILVNARGMRISGSQIAYGYGGYTASPQENVVYVSAHDNETLFDAIQYKAPLHASLEERVRMQMMALSIVALSQGVPFFHAGCELLRSKSFDRDSYNAGDWFNKLDWSKKTNNWGKGLPFEDKNGNCWVLMKERLRRKELAPAPEHILACLNHFEEMLRIRASSPLFRLRTADQVMTRVRFYNTGPGQIPGLIVMSLSDRGENRLDLNYTYILVLFNANKNNLEFPLARLDTADLVLHPIQAASSDPVVKTCKCNNVVNTVIVPGWTTAVFVSPTKAL
jgi:pullulanase-type alpha-1,6-glucosidase